MFFVYNEIDKIIDHNVNFLALTAPKWHRFGVEVFRISFCEKSFLIACIIIRVSHYSDFFLIWAFLFFIMALSKTVIKAAITGISYCILLLVIFLRLMYLNWIGRKWERFISIGLWFFVKRTGSELFPFFIDFWPVVGLIDEWNTLSRILAACIGWILIIYYFPFLIFVLFEWEEGLLR